MRGVRGAGKNWKVISRKRGREEEGELMERKELRLDFCLFVGACSDKSLTPRGTIERNNSYSSQ